MNKIDKKQLETIATSRENNLPQIPVVTKSQLHSSLTSSRLSPDAWQDLLNAENEGKIGNIGNFQWIPGIGLVAKVDDYNKIGNLIKVADYYQQHRKELLEHAGSLKVKGIAQFENMYYVVVGVNGKSFDGNEVVSVINNVKTAA